MRTESLLHTPTHGERGSFRPGDCLALALFVSGCLAVGGLGGWLTAHSVDSWFPVLMRPPLAPPNWVFGPVWTMLYVLMGVSAFLVWRRRGTVDVRSALAIFAAQLVLNLAWSGIFFGLRNPGAALVEIGVLWAAVGATFVAFRRVSAAAAALLVPYWLWVTFAAYLNGGFWWLNR